jgi:hypothetical protein
VIHNHSNSIFATKDRRLESCTVLCVCYLENHVSRGTRIDRKIAARDVLSSLLRASSSCLKKKIFVGAHGQELSAPRVQPSLGNPGRRAATKASQQHYDIVAHSVLNDDAHVAQTAALSMGNNNVAFCSFARLLKAYRLIGVDAEIFWHPGLGAVARYGML